MPLAAEAVTHVCLFHHFREAHGAIAALKDGGIAQSAIALVGDGNVGAKGLYLDDVLSSLSVPACESKRFWDGLERGGMIVAVGAPANDTEMVERVLEAHDAEPVDPCAPGDADGHRVKVFQETAAVVPGWAWGAASAALVLYLAKRRQQKAA